MASQLLGSRFPSGAPCETRRIVRLKTRLPLVVITLVILPASDSA